MEPEIVNKTKSAIKNWYLSLIVGILFIFVGIVVFATPLKSYITLSILFSVMFFINGILEIIYSISNKNIIKNWGWGLFSGIIDLLFGVLLISRPGLSSVVLPIFIGFMLLYRSTVIMSIAFDLKDFKVKGWGWLLFLGIIGAIFSFLIIWNPKIGGITIVLWTGLTLLTIGLFRILLSFELKKIKKLTENENL
jgi:uncharacterized membrane protein HdeD (DUF308 family)